MHPEYLVRMANDIASFFAAEPDKEQAARNVHAHLKRYWDPRMRAQIVAHYREGGEGLEGIVRAAGDKRLIGSRLPANAADEARVTPEGIHFTRGVQYAGANFGRVDIVMDRSALDAAMERTRVLLFALALFVIGMIGAIAYGSARQLSSPLRRLRAAIEEAASGNSAFRLSHRRNDEIGRLFDAFNQLADTIETGPGAGGPVADALEALRTRIAAPPARDRNRNRNAA